MFKCHKMSRFTAFTLAAVTFVATAITPVINAFAAGSDYYKSSLGSSAALGSPLSNTDFSSEDWDKWEMLAFGIFLGNYCKIGEDEYKSAFESGSDGLKALQFNAGGDVNSNGILRKMLNVCTTAQSANLDQIQVRYSYYALNQKTKLDLGMRSARFNDLIPVMEDGTGANIFKNTLKWEEFGPSATIEHPTVKVSLRKEDSPRLKSEINVAESGTGMDNSLSNHYILIASQAVVPEFTVSIEGERKTIFDLSNGFDSQIMAAAIAKMDKNVLQSLISENPDLKFDGFGNICAMTGGKPVIIIPAAANENINKNKEVNLLNSLIVNGLMVGNSAGKMQANASESYLESSSRWFDVMNSGSMNGLPAVSNAGDLKAGKLIMFTDTDPLMYKDLYNKFTGGSQLTTDGWGYEVDANDGTTNDDISATSPTTITTSKGNVLNSTIDMNELSMGSYINKIMDADSLHTAPFRIEYTGVNTKAFDFGVFVFNDISTDDLQGAAQVGLSLLTDMTVYNLPENSLSEMMLVNGGKSTSDVPLIKGSYFIAPALSAKIDTDVTEGGIFDKQSAKAIKYFVGSTLDTKSGDTSFRNEMKNLKKTTDIFQLIAASDTSEFNSIKDDLKPGSDYITFVKDMYEASNLKKSDANSYNYVSSKAGKPSSKGKALFSQNPLGYMSSFESVVTRICKVYKPSPEFEAVAKIYDLDANAMFSQYTTGMYLSYLKWFGILDNKTDADLRIDTKLFEKRDFLNIDPDDLIDSMSDEDKKKVITNNIMKLLDSGESGRAYRKQMISDMIEDLLDSWYTTSSKGDGTGFLNVSGYKDNMLTSFIMDNYSKYMLYAFGVLLVAVILQAILYRRSLSWFFGVCIAIFISVNAIPAYIEIVPYICNTVIQKSFEENALYWYMADDITDKSQAADMTNLASDGLTSEEEKRATVMMNSLRAQQSDKSLMVRLDTSKKVIEELNIGWEELQRHASTRWMVPNLIQQISGDSTYDYVYITAYDYMANMSRGYLASLQNSGSGSSVAPSMKTMESIMMDSFYPGEYVESTGSGNMHVAATNPSLDNKKSLFFKPYIDTSSVEEDADKTYKSTSRLGVDSNTLSHTYIYFMNNTSLALGTGLESSKFTKEVFDKVAENPSSYIDSSSFISYNTELLDHLGGSNAWNRYDSPIYGGFTNLWCTEGIGQYFYCVIKDTLNPSVYNLDAQAHALAGEISEEIDAEGNLTGKKVKKSFMHQGNTEYVRDILDLEEAFTNMIPYLHLEQIIAGGTDGKNGVLGDSLMSSEYPVYKNNLQSWLYRSNWVTKIVDDAKYSKPATIKTRDDNGEITNTETVDCMWDPRCYSIRPMVFSEAQQKSLNLKDSDLNLLELRLIRVNRDTSRDWTKLINYANFTGMNVETLQRMMTLEAVFNFNTIVTRNGTLFNTTLAQYPRGLDLRNLSWDSLMRHMLVSGSKNSAYLSTDHVMRNITQSCGIFIASVAMLVTWISASIIPLARDILLALMFFFVLLSLVFNLFKGARDKMRCALGWLFTYLLFGLFTGMFYYLVARVVGKGNTDMVLIGNASAISSSSLTSKMIIMFALDILYTLGIYKYMKDVVFKGGLSGLKAYMQDGGFSFFAGVASNMSDRISNGFKSVNNAVGGLSVFNRDTTKTEIVNSEKNTVHTTVHDGKIGSYETNKKNNKTGLDTVVDDTGYMTDVVQQKSKETTEENINKINQKIENGKKK